MDVECLDLCISCGSHVADGTPYCSARCLSMDQNHTPYLHLATPRHRPSTYPSSSSRRRLQQQQQQIDMDMYCDSPSTSYAAFVHPLEQEHHARKLASIAEWAQGVWGAGEPSLPPRSSVARTKTFPSPSRPISISPSSSSKPSTPRSIHRSSYTPPRFILSAQNLAPPAMSIATTLTTSNDDDLSSIVAPSSATSHSSSGKALHHPTPVKKHHPHCPLGAGVNPWISSPQYEYAYPKAVPDRGRSLIRA